MDEGNWVFLALELEKENAWIFNWNTEKNISYTILIKVSLEIRLSYEFCTDIEIRFFSSFIKCNSHTIQFIHLKCLIQWFGYITLF